MIKVVCAADMDEPGRARLAAVSAAARIEHVAPAVVPELEDPELEVLIAGDLPRSGPRLRWLQAPTAGVERLVRRIPAGVVLTNARGVYAPAMAEYVMWAVLQAAQDAQARRRLQQARRWPDDEKAALGRRLRGLTMVVAGYGGVGREVARLANAIGMRVVAIKARPEVTRYDGFSGGRNGRPRRRYPRADPGC